MTAAGEHGGEGELVIEAATWRHLMVLDIQGPRHCQGWSVSGSDMVAAAVSAGGVWCLCRLRL